MNPAAGSSGASDPIDLSKPGGTRSSPEPGVGKFDSKSVKEITRGLVLQLSRYVHGALATTDEERAEDLWVARSQDQRQIGDPLAKIATRHGAIDAPPDVVNLIEAGLGALAYVVFHAGKAWTIRRGKKKLAAVDPFNNNPGERP